jgi:hypothetical protein
MVLGTSLRRTGSRCALIPFVLVLEGANLIHFHLRCASSKHLQTRRFLDTLQSYLLDIQRLLVQLHRSANERPAPFVDHLGILRDSKTGRPINGYLSDEGSDAEEIAMRKFPLKAFRQYLTFGDMCFQQVTHSSIVVTWSSWVVGRNHRTLTLVRFLPLLIDERLLTLLASGKVIPLAEY